jgi:hypothetical protein
MYYLIELDFPTKYFLFHYIQNSEAHFFPLWFIVMNI